MLKILFQGDSLTDCGRDKTGHNPVQAEDGIRDCCG